jgi:hypothetical protein
VLKFKRKFRRLKAKSTKHILELILHCGTGRDLLVYTGYLWWVTQSESTTLNESWPSPTCSLVNPVDHFRWKELFTRFTLVDSTALINPGDPCKRALRFGRSTYSTHLREGEAVHLDGTCCQWSWFQQREQVLPLCVMQTWPHFDLQHMNALRN